MGEDEEATLAMLKASRGVTDGLIDTRRGRVFGSAGDGVLAEFSSPVKALRRAVEAQQELTSRNAERPEGRRMYFRIGVNLGDIIAEGDDLHGESVKIAARLEALAEPGGITISGAVHEQIAGKEQIVFTDAGGRSLKNTGRPIRMWRWASDADPSLGASRKAVYRRSAVQQHVP